MPDNYYRPTLINVAGFEPLAWRVTFTGGDNVLITQSMTARAIIISGTLFTASGGTSVTITADSSFPDQPLIAMSRLRGFGTTGISATNQQSYFVYVGYWPAGVVFKYVEFWPSAAGNAAMTVEVGLFSSTSAPNKAAQTLTKIEAGSVSTPLDANIANRNTIAFTTTLAQGTFLWCGFRRDNAGTNPTLRAIGIDMEQGHGLVITGASTTFTSTVSFLATISGGSEPQFPDLRATMV